ncbi:MAG: radical SAM protein [Candidatus Methanoperedens sp.]|nr:radical SAM protein [Candidatus Methanoperedens sp.]
MMKEIIYKKLLGGGLEKFSTLGELKWYIYNGYEKITNPKIWSNLILQKLEFRLKRTNLMSRPYVIQIEETNKCNLNCPMCYRLLQNRKFGEMDYENAKKIVDQFPYLLWISWGGWGEPLICKDLFKIIDYCNVKRIGTGFISNGTFITDDNIEKIINSKFLRMGISIDAVNPTKIRNYKDFEKIKENIQSLTKSTTFYKKNMPLRFVTTLMKENLDDLIDIIILAKEIGVKHVHIHGVGIYDDKLRRGKYDMPSKRNIEDMLKKLLIISKSQNIKITHVGLFEDNNKVTLCKFPWTTCFISWDGFVHPCCMNLTKSFGNVLEIPFTDIWNNKDYQEFRQNMINRIPDKVCRDRCGI